MRVAAVFASALMMLAAPSVAQAPASRAASVADVIRGVDVPYEQFTLPNGLRVIVHTDRKAPVVAVASWFNVGSKDEQPGRTGFAHLFEHIMLFNGTENLTNPTAVLRGVGATDWNGTTWFDRTNYFETVPTPALERALYLESERMGHLLGALTQERLDAQRGVVQNEKREGDNQPFGLVEYAELEALFPQGHPYRHPTIGSMADLDQASLEDVRGWFRGHYGPNNAVLVLAGDIDAATARPLVERYFGDIARGPAHTPVAATPPTLPARVDQVMQDRVATTRLYRVWSTPGRADPATPALDVAASILGGLGSSRLDNEMVRGDRSAVSVTGGLQSHHRVGIFELTVNVRPGTDADAASRRLDAIVEQFLRDGPTADEVRRAAMQVASGQVRALEATGGFSGQTAVLAEGALFAGDPGFYRRELAAYAALTPASVRAAARRWLGRPVYALRVNPGPRPPYEEATSTRRAAPDATPPTRGAPRPLPEVRSIAALEFPDVRRARLSNGVEVVYARRTAVPITQAYLEFDAGVAADPADRPGLQGLTLRMLTEGTTTLDSRALAEAQERLGAGIGASSAYDRSYVSLSAPSANADPVFALAADIARNPAFAPAEVERIRARQLAAIAEQQSSPEGIAQRALPALIYGEAHPYGRPAGGLGTEAAVRGFTRADLVDFHHRWIRPETLRVFVVSDLPLETLTPMLERRLGDWRPPAEPAGRKAFPAEVPAARGRVVLIDRPQSPQSYIYAGQVLPMRGAGADAIALGAANEVIAGDFLSRINQDVRERRGWSYGLYGYADLVADRMPYLVVAPVQADRTGESIAAIRDDYRAFMTTQGVTAEERERAVNGRVRQLAGQFETSLSVLQALSNNVRLNRPDDYYERAGPRYQALTPAQMDAALRGVVDPDRFVWVVVGDAATVRPQLEQLGLPVEVRPAV